jgi:hypothetical protein
MRRSRWFLRGLLVVGLFSLASSHVVKADTLTFSTLVTFTGNTVSNPPFVSSATESVTITNIGGSNGVGFVIGTLPTTNAGNGDACFGPPGCSTLLSTSTPFYVNLIAPTSGGLVIGGTAASPTISNGATGAYDQMFDQVCSLNQAGTGNSCNTNVNGSSTNTVVSYTGGVINILDASLGVDFSFAATPTPTPEPSGLLMLGSGLLGLLGFGVWRKVSV